MNTIYLNAKVDSDLDWRTQIKKAETLDHIIWHLDLGFFHELPKPIEDEGQYRCLRLALEHFVQKIWTPFSSKSKGVMIYQGGLTANLPIEYLVELVELLPDEIPLRVQVTTNAVNQIVDKAFLLCSQRFGRIQIEHDALFARDSSIGVLLPASKDMLKAPLRDFLEQNPTCRLLSEQHLTLEWDELDELHLFHQVDPITKRKLQGFEAAGGLVVDHS